MYCNKTFETASGYIVKCYLQNWHIGSCEGVLLGSIVKFDGKYSSEYEQYMESRK